MDVKTIIEWLALVLLILAGIYTAYVIKTEKKTYLKNAKRKDFFEFTLLVPHWWGEVESIDQNTLTFKRLDTRYEWQATFHWLQSTPDQDIYELYKERINERKILFDEEHAVIHNPHSFLENPLIKEGLYEMVRLEGTATEDRSERLYYDAFLIRNLKTGQYMFAESKSSVLNGLVEGPYFEEVMQRLALVSKESQETTTQNFDKD